MRSVRTIGRERTKDVVFEIQKLRSEAMGDVFRCVLWVGAVVAVQVVVMDRLMAAGAIMGISAGMAVAGLFGALRMVNFAGDMKSHVGEIQEETFALESDD